MSMKGKIIRAFGTRFLQEAVVTRVETIGDYRRLLLTSDAPIAEAGAKIQLLLPLDEVRTYTPVPTEEGIVLLGFQHADGPGSRWLREVEVGATFYFAGPSRSLKLPEGPVIIAGDETAVGAAVSYHRARPGQVHMILQVGKAEDARAAVASVGITDARAIETPNSTEASIEAIVAAHAQWPDATIALIGGSERIVTIRKALRDKKIGAIKAKSYWVPGRCGLD